MFEEKLLPLKCISPVAPYIAGFVEQKRSVGYKYNSAVAVFNIFDRFCLEEGLGRPELSPELLEHWERKRPGETEATHVIRIRLIRNLTQYMNNCGCAVPSRFHCISQGTSTFTPYIFTKEELERFFSAVDQHTPKVSVSPLRHLIMPVLFRLLYACGLRVSEATHLKTRDVDLRQGTLILRNTKGGKERMVGISDSMLTRMKNYRNRTEINSVRSEYFFPAPDTGFYDTSMIYSYFRKYLQTAGIPHRGRGAGPRMHDLRHTFSVHVLNKWSLEGKDLYTCLPILSTYLGHSNIYITEEYLRLVPDAYNDLTKSFEQNFADIFPEVQYDK